VHSRFSTNTFPSWELAHPYRMIAHNGEVNTLRGNVNWMRARESQLASELFGEDLEKVIPVVTDGYSDSGTFDNVLELLVLGGRSIAHAVMMMVPEAYRTRKDLPAEVRGFYDYHSCLMEPWDGPAAVVFTDGTLAGAVLDRNGLRPGRWVQDKDGYVVLASEAGVISIAPSTSSARAVSSPVASSSSTSRRDGSLRTRRSSSGSRARSPTASGTSARSSTSTISPSASPRRRASSPCAPGSSLSATRRRT
jgi:hypothetical protein